jgi:hypothetical protein
MGLGSGKAASGEQQRADEYEEQAHGCGQLYDLAPKELKFVRTCRFWSIRQINRRDFDTWEL